MREELSVCEAPIMKIIWESNPDISVPELVKQLNEIGRASCRERV